MQIGDSCKQIQRLLVLVTNTSSHVEDLDAEYMSVLVATALPYEVAALREAFASHLDSTTQFGLQIYVSKTST
jgi:hypothetical protein